MTKMTFAQAIESALTQAMEEDESVIIMGEDVHTLRLNLFARFGKERVKYTPISESGFVGAAVAAAMGGLRPIAEVMLVDFIAVTMDAILNHAAKISFFSGNKWNVPLVIRTACGGGYGDAGQHEQSLWGWLAHIPGLKIVVPSNPADAGGLMLSSIYEDNPVIYFEHKMLADYWMENMATGGRTTVSFDIPEKGAEGDVPDNWEPIPFGKLNRMKEGNDITFVSLGVSVHRCMEAAKILEGKGVSAEVLDLRTLVPLDVESIKNSVEKTGAVIVVDEDYMQYGLSGEISALLLEEGLSFKYGRVCTEDTIPYAIKLENQVLPNTERIVNKTLEVLNK
ncbi:MAG: alpha-ketoacid dehydrogenase subunit beta [Promethearchaeota archaeon]|jgi:pyruvate dehydrogenase E1 component beta subunit